MLRWSGDAGWITAGSCRWITGKLVMVMRELRWNAVHVPLHMRRNHWLVRVHGVLHAVIVHAVAAISRHVLLRLLLLLCLLRLVLRLLLLLLLLHEGGLRIIKLLLVMRFKLHLLRFESVYFRL